MEETEERSVAAVYDGAFMKAVYTGAIMASVYARAIISQLRSWLAPAAWVARPAPGLGS